MNGLPLERNRSTTPTTYRLLGVSGLVRHGLVGLAPDRLLEGPEDRQADLCLIDPAGSLLDHLDPAALCAEARRRGRRVVALRHRGLEDELVELREAGVDAVIDLADPLDELVEALVSATEPRDPAD